MLDLGLAQYFHQTEEALALKDFAVGLIKGSVFGVLIAIAGCMRGMQSGRSSAARSRSGKRLWRFSWWGRWSKTLFSRRRSSYATAFLSWSR